MCTDRPHIVASDAAVIHSAWCVVQYLLKHYQEADLLVMATPKATREWGTRKLATQLGTDAFRSVSDQHPLVLGRMKCSDCSWMHLAIDQSLLTAPPGQQD